MGIHIIGEAGAVKGVRPCGAVDVGVTHILQGEVHDLLGQGVGGRIVPVAAVGFGDGVLVFHGDKLRGDITGAAVAQDLVPAVGLAGDGEAVPVVDIAQDLIACPRALADPQGVPAGVDAGVGL